MPVLLCTIDIPLLRALVSRVQQQNEVIAFISKIDPHPSAIVDAKLMQAFSQTLPIARVSETETRYAGEDCSARFLVPQIVEPILKGTIAFASEIEPDLFCPTSPLRFDYRL
jgi:hypothetical protein